MRKTEFNEITGKYHLKAEYYGEKANLETMLAETENELEYKNEILSILEKNSTLLINGDHSKLEFLIGNRSDRKKVVDWLFSTRLLKR